MAEVPSEDELTEAQREYLDGRRGRLEYETDSAAEDEEELAPPQTAPATAYVTLTRQDVALLRARAEAARRD